MLDIKYSINNTEKINQYITVSDKKYMIDENLLVHGRNKNAFYLYNKKNYRDKILVSWNDNMIFNNVIPLKYKNVDLKIYEQPTFKYNKKLKKHINKLVNILLQKEKIFFKILLNEKLESIN